MTYGDLDGLIQPEDREFVKDYHIYMGPHRAVICPTGEVILLSPNIIDQAYEHLTTWALPIFVMNQ